MSDPEREDLQAISEDVAADAERLADMEREKARLDPDHPGTAELADRAERLAGDIADKARAERKLVDLSRRNNS
jgi:hypothetical protein